MKKSKRLINLIRLAEANEKEKARVYAEYRNKYDEAKARLEELESYRDEYVDSFNNVTESGIDISQFQSRHAFIARLRHVVVQQQSIVANAERAMEEHRQHWIETRRRVETLENANERALEDERARETRQEQLASDEAARLGHLASKE